VEEGSPPTPLGSIARSGTPPAPTAAAAAAAAAARRPGPGARGPGPGADFDAGRRGGRRLRQYPPRVHHPGPPPPPSPTHTGVEEGSEGARGGSKGPPIHPPYQSLGGGRIFRGAPLPGPTIMGSRSFRRSSGFLSRDLRCPWDQTACGFPCALFGNRAAKGTFGLDPPIGKSHRQPVAHVTR